MWSVFDMTEDFNYLLQITPYKSNHLVSERKSVDLFLPLLFFIEQVTAATVANSVLREEAGAEQQHF